MFETAAAVVLVIGRGLFIRSFAALSRVNLGFRTGRLLVADTAVPTPNRDAAGPSPYTGRVAILQTICSAKA